MHGKGSFGNRFIRLAVSGLLVLVVAGTASSSLAQGRRGNDRPPPPPRGDYGGGNGGPPMFFELPPEPVKNGFVFLDGDYLPPPYLLELTETSLTINGRELTCQTPPRSVDAAWGHRGGGERDRDNHWRRSAIEWHSRLDQGGTLLSFRDQPMVALESDSLYMLLKSMISVEGRALRRVALMEKLPHGFNADVWDEWITKFTVPEELRQRAAAMVANYEASEKKAKAEVVVSRLVHQLEYPLTVCGMVVTVLAIGHVLGGRPHAGKPTFGVDASPEMIRTLNWSLFYAAALSALDLAWTMTAAATGQLREINPIGSHLIENAHLAGFKIAITLSAIGLLWLLRRHKRAQLAAWWICLLLTLVTIRWLAFTSMFLPAG